MTDKEVVKDFVIAMIQRGYFDNMANNEARAADIAKIYQSLTILLNAPKLTKSDYDNLVKLRENL